MSQRLDIIHAALTGFRLTRSRPALVGVSILLFFIIVMVIQSAIGAFASVPLNALVAGLGTALADGTLSPSEAERLNPVIQQGADQFPRILGVIFVPLTVCGALFITALWRAVLAPEDKGLGGYRFGKAELRQMVMLVLLMIFYVVAETILAAIMLLVAGPMTAFSASAGALIFILLACGALALLALATVHLSMAGPATFDRGKIQVLSAWPIANHRFWPIVLIYLMAVMLAFLVAALGVVVIQPPLLLAFGGEKALQAAPVYPSVQQLFTLPWLLRAALIAVFQALQMVILVSPAADIYRQITRAEETRP